MEAKNKREIPDNTAVRTALWRALHVAIDAAPHVLEDTVGLKLIAPDEDWRQRPDMDPYFTRRVRASIAARTRFVEDLLMDRVQQGVDQYVLLGAGLDTFVQRRPDIASRIHVFEIDRPDTQEWKQKRLLELGYGLPEYLKFVGVDFELSSWWDQLTEAGFNIRNPAVVACIGVSLYLTREAILTTLKKMLALAPGSIFAMTYLIPTDLLAEEDKSLLEASQKGAKSSGNPFLSFFRPEEILSLAHSSGFEHAEVVSTPQIEKLYFSDRTDGLHPATGEDILICRL